MLGFIQKIKGLIQSQSRRKIITIAVAAIILITIPLTVFISQQQQNIRQRASYTKPTSILSLSQTYEDLLRANAIKPPGEILEVGLLYDEDKNPQLSLGEIRKLNGYVAYQNQVGDYTLQILDNQKNILYSLKFEIPNNVYVESLNPSEEIDSPVVSIKKIAFTQTVPWYSSSSSINVLDSQGHIAAVQSLLNIPKDENVPGFRSIQGDKLLKQTQNIINLEFIKRDFSLTKTFASNSKEIDGFMDIAFIGNKYDNFNRFQEDVSKLILSFLKTEPFKSRASQLRFNYVDNKIDLECKNNIVGVPGCNKFKIASVINKNSIPYDFIVVLDHDKGTLGGSISMGKTAIVATEHVEDDAISKIIIAHEVGGHLMGRLYDQYTDLSLAIKIYQKRIAKFKGNCYSGTIPNPEWKNLVGQDDYSQGCLEQSWFKASEDDLMNAYRSNPTPYFNAVSQKIINEEIDKIAGPLIDNSPPTVRITYSKDLHKLEKHIIITIEAEDDKGIAYVQLWEDDKLLKTTYIPPFFFDWDTSKEIGTHSLQVKAYDVAGNVGKSKTISFLISKSDVENLPEDNMVINPTDTYTPETKTTTICIRARSTGILWSDDINSRWNCPLGGTFNDEAECNSSCRAELTPSPTSVPPTPTTSPTPVSQFIYTQCLKLCNQGEYLASQTFDQSSCIQNCNNKYNQVKLLVTIPTSALILTPTNIPLTSTLTPNRTNQSAQTQTTAQETNPSSAPAIPIDLHSLGDANDDKKINNEDFIIWSNEFIKELNTTTSDFNGDGKIDIFDFNILRDSLNNPNLPH